MEHCCEPSFPHLHSLKTSITLATLMVFLLSNVILATYASRMLRCKPGPPK